MDCTSDVLNYYCKFLIYSLLLWITPLASRAQYAEASPCPITFHRTGLSTWMKFLAFSPLNIPVCKISLISKLSKSTRMKVFFMNMFYIHHLVVSRQNFIEKNHLIQGLVFWYIIRNSSKIRNTGQRSPSLPAINWSLR